MKINKRNLVLALLAFLALRGKEEASGATPEGASTAPGGATPPDDATPPGAPEQGASADARAPVVAAPASQPTSNPVPQGEPALLGKGKRRANKNKTRKEKKEEEGLSEKQIEALEEIRENEEENVSYQKQIKEIEKKLVNDQNTRNENIAKKRVINEKIIELNGLIEAEKQSTIVDNNAILRYENLILAEREKYNSLEARELSESQTKQLFSEKRTLEQKIQNNLDQNGNLRVFYNLP